jgi:HD-GYP domain-containing protein (c-di-GMP phosphodiesterase class II)
MAMTEISVNNDTHEDVLNSAASLIKPIETPDLEIAAYVCHSKTGDSVEELAALRKKVQSLSRQLDEERQLNNNLRCLYLSGSNPKSTADQQNASQNIIRYLQPLFPGSLIAIYVYHPAGQYFHRVAAHGEESSLALNSLPSCLNQQVIIHELNSRAVTAIPMPALPAVLPFSADRLQALVAAPLYYQEKLRGVIMLAGSQDSLNPALFPLIEAAGAHLLNQWECARQTKSLTDFVQSIATLSLFQETGSLMDRVATITMQALNASFSAIAVLDRQQWQVRTSGTAPRLQKSLQNGAVSFLFSALHASRPIRLDDLSTDVSAGVMHIDRPELRSLLACPFHINSEISGLLLAWGKSGGCGFSETDEFFAELLAARAAENLENCYLNQELRSSLKTTELLYDLSLNISQAEDLKDASMVIVRAAFRMLEAKSAGLILFGHDGRQEAEVLLPLEIPGASHPFGLIQQAMNSGQTIYLAETESLSWVAIPIQTSRRCYGALWLEIDGNTEDRHHPTEDLRVLINQAAVALERSILLEETRHQAKKLVQANWQMNEAYMQTLGALMQALDVRDSETEGHSERVTELSIKLGLRMGLSKSELGALKLGAMLHDIGKIGISDMILLKAGPLTDDEWKAMHQHPKIGASIVQKIPALHGALQVIAFHHERWNGSGYPSRLTNREIPLLARIFAVIDVFDALTRDRPYRDRKFTCTEALDYLQENSGVLFDPDVVGHFTEMIQAEYPELL